LQLGQLLQANQNRYYSIIEAPHILKSVLFLCISWYWR